MRRIPVDTSRVRFVGTGKSATRAKYAELSDGSRRRVPDAQDTNEDGVPLTLPPLRQCWERPWAAASPCPPVSDGYRKPEIRRVRLVEDDRISPA
jgi:hypothetical protein